MARAFLPAVSFEIEDVDEQLTSLELEHISLFDGVKDKKNIPNFSRFPGSTLLRKCYQGRVMCRQNEAGASAFYILTTQDVIGLRKSQVQFLAQMLSDSPPQENTVPQKFQDKTKSELEQLKSRFGKEIEVLTSRQARIEAESDTNLKDQLLAVAKVKLRIAGEKDRPKRRGLIQRVKSWLRRPARKTDSPSLIPIDSSVPLDGKTLEADLHEADIFGEMSCRNLAPRSASVTVTHDCYMLEFLRNVLDTLDKDKTYREKNDRIYRARVLDRQVRDLPLFKGLTDQEFLDLRPKLKLVDFEAGTIIFDEHEESDCLYLVRKGLVKVVKNASALITPQEIDRVAWADLAADLVGKRGNRHFAANVIWNAVPIEIQELLGQCRILSDLARLPEQILSLRSQSEVCNLELDKCSKSLPDAVKEASQTARRLPQAASALGEQLTVEIRVLITDIVEILATTRKVWEASLAHVRELEKKTDRVLQRFDQIRALLSTQFLQLIDTLQQELRDGPENWNLLQCQVQEILSSLESAGLEPRSPQAIWLADVKKLYAKMVDLISNAKMMANSLPAEILNRFQETPDLWDAGKSLILQLKQSLNRVGNTLSKLENQRNAIHEAILAVRMQLSSTAAREENRQPLEERQRQLERELQRFGSKSGDLPASVHLYLAASLNDFIRSASTTSFFGDTKSQLLNALDSPPISETIREYPEDPAKWSESRTRIFHRALLELAAPVGMPRREVHRERTLNYLSHGDVLGEMGVLNEQPRSATCLAFSQHDRGQEQSLLDLRATPSRVELVKLMRSDLVEVAAKHKNFARILDTAKKRRASTLKENIAPQSIRIESLYSQTPEFEQLGLVQGQKLMLIDLEKCTRCNACVEACVDAHDDGRTRLYLDGPRFDKYLIPITCRSCVDPVCLIGCPVGAIYRGDGGEINIHNHCIGCNTCTSQCPYGSIHKSEREEPASAFAQTMIQLDPGVEVGSDFTKKAVVCDLCRTSPTRGPACVYACPHDAALRVDARDFFGVTT